MMQLLVSPCHGDGELPTWGRCEACYLRAESIIVRQGGWQEASTHYLRGFWVVEQWGLKRVLELSNIKRLAFDKVGLIQFALVVAQALVALDVVPLREQCTHRGTVV